MGRADPATIERTDVAPHLHRSSAAPLGTPVGGTGSNRGLRTVLQACAANQREFSRTALRVLLALALLLVADCYMLRAWLDVPPGRRHDRGNPVLARRWNQRRHVHRSR